MLWGGRARFGGIREDERVQSSIQESVGAVLELSNASAGE